MSEVMIDLETLSTRANAVILTIGAIKFNRRTYFNKNGETNTYKDLNEKSVFYRRIKISSCKKLGMHTSQETQDWWDAQDEEVRNEAFKDVERISLKRALREFTEWFGNSTCIWGNGSSFDVSIIGEAYNLCDMKIPYKFWLIRDLRTLFDLGGVKMKDLPVNGKHHALHDCYRQIIGLKKAITNIYGN